MSENKQRRMNAYYYSFEETGCDPIDDVLEAVARAGKAYHHTAQWSYPDFGLKPGEVCEAEKIQNAANASTQFINESLAAARAQGRTEGLEEAANVADDVQQDADSTPSFVDSLQLEGATKAETARMIAVAIRARKGEGHEG